ncbi:alpha/beta hydrolase family protein [Shouchella clausii]|uniref:alpha/beta hydrolase family protein n=1 Tax=Shouchella clausii TaxID=79880 RepID=UPI001C736210|nr:alpha/beta hydrolase family protein [Shouchella clausii]MBX0320595.1 alpha/beta hydrolase family protein [Shouchella clausii]
MAEIDDYLQGLYRQEVGTINCKDERLAALREAMGDFPKATMLEATCLYKRQHPSFTESAYVLPTTAELKLPFRLFEPVGGNKETVVLALHGHGAGAEEALQEDSSHNAFALKLVEQGAVVVLPELAGFGARKRKQDQAEQNSCFSIASHLLLYGKTLAGLRVFECARLLDWVGETRRGNIGCIGFSGGALIALLLAATDERIKATVLSGFASLMRDSILASRHCLDNYIPGLLAIGETPQLLELINPRALFIESGSDDHLFPSESVKQALHESKWGEADFFAGGHQVNGTKAIPWLCNELGKEKQQRGTV